MTQKKKTYKNLADHLINELTKYFLMPKNHPKLLNIHKQLIVCQKKIHLVIK